MVKFGTPGGGATQREKAYLRLSEQAATYRLRLPMSAQPKMEATPKIPTEVSLKLRALAHDLSNSLEPGVPAPTLLSPMPPAETASGRTAWIDHAARSR